MLHKGAKPIKPLYYQLASEKSGLICIVTAKEVISTGIWPFHMVYVINTSSMPFFCTKWGAITHLVWS